MPPVSGSVGSGRMSPERRGMLVRTAATEFASAGYEHASLNRIIKACGLSKSSFYHVVASKQALFDLVVADLGAALSETLRVPEPGEFAGDRFWPEVDALFDRLLVASNENESSCALGRMFYLSGTPGEGTGAVDATLASVESWVHDVLVVGRESEAVRTDLPVSLQSGLVFAVLRVLDEWSLRHRDEFESDAGADLVAAQLQTIRRMLEPGTP